MENKCFYCDDEIDEKHVHYISFFHENEEREETMCKHCYAEWLEGIKE
ncbi:hypothetical protein [Pueribacillus theae]|nr:hypothetical protein [Pueribacillus theae]